MLLLLSQIAAAAVVVAVAAVVVVVVPGAAGEVLIGPPFFAHRRRRVRMIFPTHVCLCTSNKGPFSALRRRKRRGRGQNKAASPLNDKKSSSRVGPIY